MTSPSERWTPSTPPRSTNSSSNATGEPRRSSPRTEIPARCSPRWPTRSSPNQPSTGSTPTPTNSSSTASPTGDANDPALTPKPSAKHHPHADTDHPNPVPSHWRKGGPIPLAGDNRDPHVIGLRDRLHRQGSDPMQSLNQRVTAHEVTAQRRESLLQQPSLFRHDSLSGDPKSAND